MVLRDSSGRTNSGRTDSGTSNFSANAVESGVRAPQRRMRDVMSSVFTGPVSRPLPREPDIEAVRREPDIEVVPREPDIEAPLPTPRPPLQEWKPLHIEKRPHQCCKHCTRRKRWSEWVFVVVVVVLLSFLFGNIVALNLATFGRTHASPTSAAASGMSTGSGGANSTSNTTTLSANEALCLAEFNINAPANAQSYPCSTCFSVLQGVPSSYLNANAEDAQGIRNAIQFCALQSIFVEAEFIGQAVLSDGGWMQNVNFCAWNGVRCNTTGQVTTLELIAPAVPTIIPSDIGGLTGLQTLKIVGDSEQPAGSLPNSFVNLTALTTLELESTAIGTLPDDLFISLKNITTLILDNNSKMGSSLPSSLTALSLENLVVTNQDLTNPLSTLSSSTSLQSSLKLLNLSTTNITGPIPSTIAKLTSLVELFLDDNHLTDPLPNAFPAKLEILNLADNAALSGTVSGSFCSAGDLQQCDVQGTALTPAGSCSVCTFSS